MLPPRSRSRFPSSPPSSTPLRLPIPLPSPLPSPLSLSPRPSPLSLSPLPALAAFSAEPSRHPQRTKELLEAALFDVIAPSEIAQIASKFLDSQAYTAPHNPSPQAHATPLRPPRLPGEGGALAPAGRYALPRSHPPPQKVFFSSPRGREMRDEGCLGWGPVNGVLQLELSPILDHLTSAAGHGRGGHGPVGRRSRRLRTALSSRAK